MMVKNPNWFRRLVIAALVFLLVSGIVGAWKASKGGSFLPYVAKVTLSGAIMDADEVLDKLKTIREDQDAKALLVVIDSPGGAVVPSEAIYYAVKRISQDRPVAVSMRSLAASGGYMVACGADRLFAYESTLTGSIGVIMNTASVAGLLQRIGIEPYVIKSGDLKDAGSPLRDMSMRDREYLQDLVMGLRGRFVQIVADGRKLSPQAVNSLADGRVFTGREAKRLGLVDAIGDEEDAADWLRAEARLPKDAEVTEIESTQQRFLKALEGVQERVFVRLFSASTPHAYFF